MFSSEDLSSFCVEKHIRKLLIYMHVISRSRKGSVVVIVQSVKKRLYVFIGRSAVYLY